MNQLQDPRSTKVLILRSGGSSVPGKQENGAATEAAAPEKDAVSLLACRVEPFQKLLRLAGEVVLPEVRFANRLSPPDSW